MFEQFAALVCLVGCAGLAHAGVVCTEIETPPSNKQLETIKQLIVDGKYHKAFQTFDISDPVKLKLANGVEAVLPETDVRCVTMKRVRQSDHFISEFFMTEGENQTLYWTISGQTLGDRFKMVHMNYTDDFEDIKGYLY